VNLSIELIHEDALKELETAADAEGIKALSVRFLGRKGLITQFLRNISSLPEAQRPQAGKKANQTKKALDKAFKAALKRIEADSADSGNRIDVSLPGRSAPRGSLHPITRITQRVCDIFSHLGFDIAEGPETETDYYNFEALNVPKFHPARDMQDTFYVSDNIVLRTQTSPMQIRVMEKQPHRLPSLLRARFTACDSDLTHTPMFHQIEGLLVDQNVSFGDLKGTLTTFVHQMFDDKISLRFRPSFFPFTEPSAEVDILCVMCRGKGCRVCSHSGWLEILGAGMVHPNVFGSVGYDTSRYTGFAFGMGIERIAMLKYGIDDIRKFFDNDLRFLRQF